MYLIDTHTHIYLPEFEADLDSAMRRAGENNVEAMFLPAIDSTTHEKMLRLVKEYPVCKPMIGLHPCSVTRDFVMEIEIIRQYLATTDFIAIGEIGLDFYWSRTFEKEQYEAFRNQLEIALEKNLPVSIHSRNATDECIEVVSDYPGIKGVFHCFSGNADQAGKIKDLGFMLGIGGVITFKNSGLDKVIKEVGIDQVILETDAPYLSPVPYRGKRNEPAYTRLVAERLAEISGRSLEKIAEFTTGNALKLFDVE